MPAPKFLSGLPKPVLFGLYGAVGGLIGALVFGELILLALGPKTAEKPPPPPPPEPRLAVGASKDVQIYQGGTNKLLVQIDRDAFDDAVTVRIDGLPAGVTAREVTIPAKETKGEIELRAAFATRAGPGVEHKDLKVVATGRGGRPTAETTFALTPLASPMPQADIVFVLDVTSSMQPQIDGLKSGIGTFAGDLARAKVDARFGCIAFRDLAENEPSQTLTFKGEKFTADADAFRTAVGGLIANGGGDFPESSLEALTEATGFDFRKEATRTLVLITDAAPKIRDQGVSVKSTADALTTRKIDLLHLVINDPGRTQYLEVQRGAIGVTTDKGADRGKEFGLDATARDAGTFTTRLMPEMTKAIVAAAEAKPAVRPELKKTEEAAAPALTKTVKAVQSDQVYEADQSGRLVLAVGVWTGAIAALVCLFLIGGQHHYLRGTLPSAGGIVAGLAGGLIAGLIGGAAGQGLFLLAPDNDALAVIFRVLGWTLLGALAGVGLSLFVPNLKLVYGLAGGAVGGAAGALGYIAVEAAAGALLGRLAGGLALGLCIGLMVAAVEAAFRRAWLEVRYGPREVVTVNLGPEPVKVGGDAKACTVWARARRDRAPLLPPRRKGDLHRRTGARRGRGERRRHPRRGERDGGGAHRQRHRAAGAAGAAADTEGEGRASCEADGGRRRRASASRTAAHASPERRAGAGASGSRAPAGSAREAASGRADTARGQAAARPGRVPELRAQDPGPPRLALLHGVRPDVLNRAGVRGVCCSCGTGLQTGERRARSPFAIRMSALTGLETGATRTANRSASFLRVTLSAIDERAAAGDVVAADRTATARAVRGGHVPRQWPRRAEAEQDQLRRPAPAHAHRPHRHRRREPLAARQQGQSPHTPLARTVPSTARPASARSHTRRCRRPSRLRRGARRLRPTPHERERPAVLARGRRGSRCAGSRRGACRGRGGAARRVHRQPDRLPPHRAEGVAGGEPAARRERAQGAEVSAARFLPGTAGVPPAAPRMLSQRVLSESATTCIAAGGTPAVPGRNRTTSDGAGVPRIVYRVVCPLGARGPTPPHPLLVRDAAAGLLLGR